MNNELIAVISVIEGGLYDEVKEFWSILEDQYQASSVRIFDHPTITIQGGTITLDNLEILKENFYKFGEKVKPYTIGVRELGHIEKHSIYFKVDRDSEIGAVNIMVNSFLGIFCNHLMEDYTPENYRPHIALALNDLTDGNFDRAWFTFGQVQYQYSQILHNLCLVKFEENGKLTLLTKIELT
jgi:2'-5' RNA ligase